MQACVDCACSNNLCNSSYEEKTASLVCVVRLSFCSLQPCLELAKSTIKLLSQFIFLRYSLEGLRLRKIILF